MKNTTENKSRGRTVLYWQNMSHMTLCTRVAVWTRQKSHGTQCQRNAQGVDQQKPYSDERRLWKAASVYSKSVSHQASAASLKAKLNFTQQAEAGGLLH